MPARAARGCARFANSENARQEDKTMVRKSRNRPSDEPESIPIRWGWVYLWLLLVFSVILLATTQSVERKALAMKMDGLIEKKLSLNNTLAEVRVKYLAMQTFQEMKNKSEALHLELAPSPLPPIRLDAAPAAPGQVAP